jgi:hypothetical protein
VTDVWVCACVCAESDDGVSVYVGLRNANLCTLGVCDSRSLRYTLSAVDASTDIDSPTSSPSLIHSSHSSHSAAVSAAVALFSDIEDLSSGRISCTSAASWVMGSYVVVLVGLFIPVLLVLVHKSACRAKIPFPRVIGSLSSFVALTFSIVAVAKWFDSCQNTLPALPNFAWKTGYSVAVAIVCIVLLFIGFLLYLWLVYRPAVEEASSPRLLSVSGGEVSSDGYVQTSPQGSWQSFGHPSNGINAARAGQAYNIGHSQQQQPYYPQYGR